MLQGERPHLTSLRELMNFDASDTTAQLFPGDTHLVTEPTLRQGVLYLNFSEEIQQIEPATEAVERLTLEALVRSVTEHKEVTSVQVLVDGRKVQTLAGHFDISRPLSRSSFTSATK